jgi:hypothetical protein
MTERVGDYDRNSLGDMTRRVVLDPQALWVGVLAAVQPVVAEREGLWYAYSIVYALIAAR